MLPPPPLGTRPEGVLDVLGIKTGGRYPQTLGETLAPTLELQHLYWAQRAAYTLGASTTFSGGVGLGTEAWTIPASENWMILQASLAVNLAAGVTGFGVGLIASPNPATFNVASTTGIVLVPTNLTPYVHTFAGGVWFNSVDHGGRLILPAGARIWPFASTYSGAGNALVYPRLSYVRLPL